MSKISCPYCGCDQDVWKNYLTKKFKIEDCMTDFKLFKCVECRQYYLSCWNPLVKSLGGELAPENDHDMLVELCMAEALRKLH